MYKILPLIILLCTNCVKEERFPELGSKVVNPIDVAVDPSERFFYALNSDYPRDYNQGSILVLDMDGNKIRAIPLPRLGRSLTVAGNILIVTVSNSGEAPQKVMLFDISTPDNPTLAKSFEPESCNPVNALARANYRYWAISCSNGNFLAGELTTPLENSNLQLVRSYPQARRALHIDTSRNLLLAFPTDFGDQTWGDMMLEDKETFSEVDGTSTQSPNEIPDAWEKTLVERFNKGRRGIYQFAVYDFEAAKASNWEKKNDKDSLGDLRWVYFNLATSDGSLDFPATTENQNSRYYRTNFWEAKPDATDASTFYLSHRGSMDARYGGSQHANNIIRVRITGDLKNKNLKTQDVLSFERIYGFKGEVDGGRQFPGDFELVTISSKLTLIINHFRDLVNWPGSPYFSVAAKVVGDNQWLSEISSTVSGKSYYQIAATSSGRAMATNFYGNTLILLDVKPGVGITEKDNIIQ